MAEFNYKKWVTENKYGIQPTIEGINGMLNEQPVPCDATSAGNLGCEIFQECGTTTPYAYHFMSTNYTNTYFHQSFCSNPAIGEIVEIQEGGGGNILLLEYKGVVAGTLTLNLGGESSWNYNGNLGPTTPTPGTGCTPPIQYGWECPGPGQTCTQTCTPINNTTCHQNDTDCQNSSACQNIDGCMDQTATNYDPTATQDDGSCFWGYFCRRQTTPQDVGFKKSSPGELGDDDGDMIGEWAGIDMCFEADPGQTGDFPDLQSCRNNCGLRHHEPPKKGI